MELKRMTVRSQCTLLLCLGSICSAKSAEAGTKPGQQTLRLKPPTHRTQWMWFKIAFSWKRKKRIAPILVSFRTTQWLIDTLSVSLSDQWLQSLRSSILPTSNVRLKGLDNNTGSNRTWRFGREDFQQPVDKMELGATFAVDGSHLWENQPHWWERSQLYGVAGIRCSQPQQYAVHDSDLEPPVALTTLTKASVPLNLLKDF